VEDTELDHAGRTLPEPTPLAVVGDAEDGPAAADALALLQFCVAFREVLEPRAGEPASGTQTARAADVLRALTEPARADQYRQLLIAVVLFLRQVGGAAGRAAGLWISRTTDDDATGMARAVAPR
jgi:hypothetical protein